MTTAQRWTTEDVTGFGREVFEAIPEAERARWAADVLDLCSIACPDVAAVARVVAIGRKPHRRDWYGAGEAFHALRALTLAEERRSCPEGPLSRLLFAAENAAKVIANAGGAAFDADSGWWIAPLARAIVLEAGDPALEERVWTRLTRLR